VGVDHSRSATGGGDVDLLVTFAKSGNPNSPVNPLWPAFTDDNSKVLHLGDPTDVGGIVNINGLNTIDAVYKTLREKSASQR
jgi:hypothetical protein